MKFIDQIKQIRFEQKVNYVVIFVLLLVLIIQSLVNVNLANANNRAYKISIPPSLEFGLATKTGVKTDFEVHQFAGYIEQQLYFWQQDGEQDFKNNIANLWPFLTPRYREYLSNKYNNLLNLGQLSGREKSLIPLKPFDGSLVVKNKFGWQVSLDFKAEEFIDNVRFKNKKQRHFIQVIRRDINPEYNPWGLQLDVPLENIKELK